jgi:hypothetical protein
MARNHGRISTSIWDDPEFIALPATQQRMYMFLLAQRNLNHAGLLPLTMTRWSSRYAGGSPAAVKADLQGLAAARFIVVDATAEELLIRTLVKNDDIYKQPRIMQRLIEDAQEITSPKLRAALLAELERLPLHELSDKPAAGKDPRSVRQVAVESVQAIRDAFGVAPASPSPDPSEGVAAGVSHTLPGTPPNGSAEGFRGGLPEGTVRGSSHADARAAPTPSPLPPIPPTAGSAENGAAAADTTQPVIAEWLDSQHKRPPGTVISQVGKHVKAMLGEGIDPADVRAGLAAWQARRLHPSALPSVVHEVMCGPPTTGPSRPSTTDQRVRDHLELAAQLRAEEAAAQQPHLRALPGGAA